MNPYARLVVCALGCLAVVGCSSATGDATGPTASPPTVTLTVSPVSMTTPGDIELVAAANSANAGGVRRVEFYERVMNVDASPRKIGEDAEAPYELKRSILSEADNGTREFTAKAYDAAGQVGTSNPSTVVVAVEPTPMQVTVSASHTRITTPGGITYTTVTTKPFARAEIYSGTTKVAEIGGPLTRWEANIAVTAANNGTQTFLLKVYDAAGSVVESAPMVVVVDIRWGFIQSVDGVHSHGASLVAVDATNAVYLAGTTDTWDVFLVKHDADGNRLWIRTLGGPDAERANSIGVDASGRIYIAANGYSPPLGSGNCFLAIYDPGGTLVRTQQIGGALANQAFGCVAASDASGNFYIAGWTPESTQGHGFVIKYDRDGAALWTQKFGGTPFPSSQHSDDILTSIAVDPLGGVYVGGYTDQSFDGAPNRGRRDIFVLKFDADGTRLWASQYGLSGVYTFGDHLAADPEGGVYFAGQVVPDVGGAYGDGNALLLRYGTDGALRWVRTLEAGGDVGAEGVAADLRGVYLVGHTNRGGSSRDLTEPTQGGYDGFLAQLSRDGNLLSLRLLGSPANEYANGVAIGVNGDLYVAAEAVYNQPDLIFTPMLARHRDVPP